MNTCTNLVTVREPCFVNVTYAKFTLALQDIFSLEQIPNWLSVSVPSKCIFTRLAFHYYLFWAINTASKSAAVLNINKWKYDFDFIFFPLKTRYIYLVLFFIDTEKEIFLTPHNFIIIFVNLPFSNVAPSSSSSPDHIYFLKLRVVLKVSDRWKL